MKDQIIKYLNDIAYICNSDIPEDEGQIYRSKVDNSYVGRVGLENCPILKFIFEHNINDLQSPNGNTACIGFSDTEQKWYGWSHRAIYGFTVGSEVKRGDCAYVPTDKDDFLQDMIRFWSEENHINVKAEHAADNDEEGVHVSWEYDDKTPNEKMRGSISGAFSAYPEKWGRGEWTAKSLEDAKQMAIDFAYGVG